MNRDEQFLSHLVGDSSAAGKAVTEKIITATTNPAANTEISETVPTGKIWRLLAARVSLAQGATQTPLPYLTLDDGTTEFLRLPGASAALSASTTATFQWIAGLTALSAGAGGTVQYAPFPSRGVLLPAGYRIKTVTTGIGANTDFAAPVFHVLEYA